MTEETWNPEGFKIDYGSRWAKFTLKAQQRSVEASAGKSIPAINPFGGTGDTLAHLRGNEQLLLDVIERPELVRQTELRLMDLWIEHHKKIYDIVAPGSDGGFRSRAGPRHGTSKASAGRDAAGPRFSRTAGS